MGQAINPPVATRSIFDYSLRSAGWPAWDRHDSCCRPPYRLGGDLGVTPACTTWSAAGRILTTARHKHWRRRCRLQRCQWTVGLARLVRSRDGKAIHGAVLWGDSRTNPGDAPMPSDYTHADLESSSIVAFSITSLGCIIVDRGWLCPFPDPAVPRLREEAGNQRRTESHA